jgi:glycosyltransferase involved in cell wall biosynthesis
METGGSSLAVIVPFYRGMAFVPRLQESLGGQAIDEIIFVVDDNESGPALRREFASWSNVRVLETSGSLGTSPARNVGIREATSEWIALLDQDDWWPDDFVERLALRDDDSVVAYDNLIWTTVGGVEQQKSSTVLQEADFTTASFDKNDPVVKDYLPMFKLVLRRADALAVGGYSEWAYAVEDYDFVMKLLSKGLRIDIRDEPLGHHLWHGESISRQIAAGSHRKGMRAFRTWMRIYLRLSFDRSFPRATRNTFVWRFGVAAKGWALLALGASRRRVPAVAQAEE